MKKKGIIKLYCIVIFIFVLICPNAVYSQSYDGYGVIINNTQMDKAIQIREIEGLTYIPLHLVKESLGINIEIGKDKLFLRSGKQNFDMKLEAGRAFHEAFGNMPLVVKGSAVLAPVLMLKDMLHFNIEVLEDIRCLRIVTKPGMLAAAQLIDRLSGKENNTKKVAYLTFDDGLEGKMTPQILDILKRYNVKASFFIIGNTVNRNKELLKRIVAEGHSVGNHTYTHKREIIYSSVDLFSEELKKTSQVIADVTGKAPKLFRPPYGMNYIKSEAYQKALADYTVAGWNVDSMDSRSKDISSSQIVGYVKYQVKNKSKAIILLHNSASREETVKALPEIIEYLADSGYEILPLE